MAVEAPYISEKLVPNIRGYLHLFLGRKIVEVPWMDKNGVTLAYFDARNPILQDVGARELARLTIFFSKPRIVISPSSGKSTEMIARACQMVDSKPTLLEFQKGNPKSPIMQHHIVNAAYSVKYKPITAEERSERIMTVTMDQADMIREMVKNSSEDLVFMDDVISTGATIDAMRELVAKILQIPKEELKFPALAVVNECCVGSDGKMVEGYDKNTAYAVQTPVFASTDDVGIFNVMPYVSYPYSNNSVPYFHPRTTNSEPLDPLLAVPQIVAQDFVSITDPYILH